MQRTRVSLHPANRGLFQVDEFGSAKEMMTEAKAKIKAFTPRMLQTVATGGL
jgi:hypothetical protein